MYNNERSFFKRNVSKGERTSLRDPCTRPDSDCSPHAPDSGRASTTVPPSPPIPSVTSTPRHGLEPPSPAQGLGRIDFLKPNAAAGPLRAAPMHVSNSTMGPLVRKEKNERNVVLPPLAARLPAVDGGELRRSVDADLRSLDGELRQSSDSADQFATSPWMKHRGMSVGQAGQPGTMCQSQIESSTSSGAHTESQEVSSQSENVPACRKQAIQHAFHVLDPEGLCYRFSAPSELKKVLDVRSSLHLTAKQDLCEHLMGVSLQAPGPGGGYMLPFDGFFQYYKGVSRAMQSDQEFDDILTSHWGFLDMNRALWIILQHFAMAGLGQAFQNHSCEGSLGPQELSDGFQRVGLRLCSGDLQQLAGLLGQGAEGSVQELQHKMRSFCAKAPLIEAAEHDRENAPSQQTEEMNRSASICNIEVHSACSELCTEPDPEFASLTPRMSTEQGRPGSEQEELNGKGFIEPIPENSIHIQASYPYPVASELNIEKRCQESIASIEPQTQVQSQPQSHLQQQPQRRQTRPAWRKALTVGIDYPNLGDHRLKGCVNESNAMIGVITKTFGFQISDIRQLRDDHPQAVPTRSNILAGIAWLIDGAQAGDQLFLHYSGHGGQSRPHSNTCSATERDGQDEALVPCDFQTAGTIGDDELRQRIVLALPKGVSFLMVLDCRHVGTPLGLPFKILSHRDSENASIVRKPAKYVGEKGRADIVVLSSCVDGPSSSGDLSAAFIHAVQSNLCCSRFDVLAGIRNFLKQKGTGQMPQLSSEHFLDLETCWMSDVEQVTPGIPVSVSPSLRPPNRRALTVGIKYFSLAPGRGHSNAIGDSDKMFRVLTSILGVPECHVRQLRDDSLDTALLPTRANLLREFQNLVCDVVPGDELFFHFSGQARDGRSDGITPCDLPNAGIISSDNLRQLLVAPLPAGSRLTIVLDGGSTFDGAFKFLLHGDDRTTKVIRGNDSSLTKGEVIAISEFRDDQATSDFLPESVGGRKSLGAITQAFASCVTENISYHKLLQRMKRYLRKHGYAQMPQISSEQFLKLDESLVAHGRDSRPDSRPLSTAHCPPSQSQEGIGELDMELAQMEANVRELRRKKAEEEQTSAAQAQIKPNVAPGLSGLPMLGTPLLPSAPSGPKPDHTGRPGQVPLLGQSQESGSGSAFDSRQSFVPPGMVSGAPPYSLCGPSGATSKGPSAPKQIYATGTQAPPLGGHHRYGP